MRVDMRREPGETPDGRPIVYYTGTGPLSGDPVPAMAAAQADAADAHERRWDHEQGEWVLYAPSRQERPVAPVGAAGACPLCPPAAADPVAAWHEVRRDDFRVAVFPNRFPPLGPIGVGASVRTDGSRASRGACEMVLYTPCHDASLGALGEDHVADLVRVWADRTRALLALPGIRHVFVFENRGAEVGATLAHPHGQIYGLAFAPPRVRRIAVREAAARRREGACPVCARLAAERAAGVRVVDGEGGWLAYVPFAARMPYELTLVPAACVGRLDGLADPQVQALGALLRRTVRRYDGLFDAPMPYMMALLQGGRPGGVGPAHLRLGFHPVRRSETQMKRLAASEALGGQYLVDLLPEAMAERLRAVSV